MPLRPAHAADAPAVTVVFQAARRISLPYLPVLHSDEEDHAFLAGVVAAGGVTVAEVDGEVVAFLTLGERIDHLYVHPDHHRQGLGSALLRAAQAARPRLELWVFQRNAGAIAFYKAHGFEVVEVTEGANNEEQEPDFLMAWPTMPRRVMETASIAESEPQRLAALRSTALLDTPAEPAFDELVTLTARLLNAPIAAFNLLDSDRQWTKAGSGMANGDETPWADSFCAHAITGEIPLVIPDTAADPRFAENAMGLGFYAGTAVMAGGQRIGTLCVAGDAPHAPSADDLETLRVLAAAVSAHVELSRRERERAEEAGVLRRLGEATSRLARVSDSDELEHDLCVAAQDLAVADGAILWTATPSGMLRATAAVGSDITGAELPPGHGAASRQAFDNGERIYRARDELLGIAGWAAALFQPLLLRDRPVGVLTVFWYDEPALVPERELQLIELLSIEAAVAIERTTTLNELEKLTRVDALTGIGNRRAFDEQLGRELKRAEREGTPVALAMFDLDHFKVYNDTHGHPEGDRLLREIAAAWQECLRATDSLARYGGEEFALIAPGCVPGEAVTLVDRLRAAVTENQTCSAGVALWDGKETPAELLARADAALYAAKLAGRDRTHLATERETAPAPTEG
jgi:diguanylate cyclase (GGDEF)-like protein